MRDFVCIPISCATYNEFSLRLGKSTDPSSWIENIVNDYLERTEGDAGIWGNKHSQRVRTRQEIDATLMDVGPADKGYLWGRLLLNNGSRLRMKYKGSYDYAVVRHGQILYEGSPVSPSEFASLVADGTSRNAWRDIDVQFPHQGEDAWTPANSLRRSASKRALV